MNKVIISLTSLMAFVALGGCASQRDADTAATAAGIDSGLAALPAIPPAQQAAAIASLRKSAQQIAASSGTPITNPPATLTGPSTTGGSQ